MFIPPVVHCSLILLVKTAKSEKYIERRWTHKHSHVLLEGVQIRPIWRIVWRCDKLENAHSSFILTCIPRETLTHVCRGTYLLQWCGSWPVPAHEMGGLYSSQLCVEWCHVSSLKSVMVRLFTPQELANITNKGFFFFFFNRMLMVKHLLVHHCKYALCSLDFNRKTLANLHFH